MKGCELAPLYRKNLEGVYACRWVQQYQKQAGAGSTSPGSDSQGREARCPAQRSRAHAGSWGTGLTFLNLFACAIVFIRVNWEECPKFPPLEGGREGGKAINFCFVFCCVREGRQEWCGLEFERGSSHVFEASGQGR